MCQTEHLEAHIKEKVVKNDFFSRSKTGLHTCKHILSSEIPFVCKKCLYALNVTEKTNIEYKWNLADHLEY